MIQVNKPAAPTVLTVRGRNATAADRAAYDRGQRAFRFRPGIYAHARVKAALRAAQFDKCAFCESKFAHIAYGDVEHFRPKGGFRQREADPLQQPGYFWLAYDWDNLFASCTLCNQRFKRNLFPVRVQKYRPRCHHDDPTREKPVLLNPAADHPGRHIAFTGSLATPRTRRGAETIRLIGLNRPELVERRLDRRTELVELREAYDNLLARLAPPHTPAEQEWLARNASRLATAVLPTAEYSAMAKALLAGAAIP